MPADTIHVPVGALKGRGTAWALEHRFSAHRHEAVDDGWGSLEQRVLEDHPPPTTQVIEEQVRSILTGNDSPDIGFDLSINPYRGCEHVMRHRYVFSRTGCQGGQGAWVLLRNS